MGNAARKARKREGVQFEHKDQKATPFMARVVSSRRQFKKLLLQFEASIDPEDYAEEKEKSAE